MDPIAILGLLILGAMVLNLRARVSQLEWTLRQSQTQSPTAVASSVSANPATLVSNPTQVSPTTSAPAAVSQVANAPVSAPRGPSADEQFVAWLKEDWLLKLGALLLLIGFGWLVSYAFLNNWIGPVGRITLGLVVGASVLSLGAFRMRAYVTQGSVFVVLGATIMLLTTYAARAAYDFFTPTSALALMLVTSAFVSMISGVYNRKQLAIAGTALALFAPLLTHSPTHDFVGLFAYIMVVVWGAVWVVAWKGFREVVTVALVGVGLYSIPVLSGLENVDMAVLLLFAYGFATTFYIVHTAGLLRLRGNDAMPDLATAAGNALLLLAWVYVAAPKDFQSLILAAWATAFIVGAFMVFRATGEKTPLYLYAAIGVGYIAAATAIELNGAALTIAYTFEAAAVAATLFGVTRDVRMAQRSAFLLAVPIFLSFNSMISSDWQYGVLNQHFFVLAALSAVLAGLGGYFYQAAHETGIDDVKNGNTTLLVLGSMYFYVLVWLSIHAALPRNADTAAMIALTIYTIIGIAAYLEGFAETNKSLRVYGGALLGFVVARLLLVDVWQMELTGKIITFFLVGTLLMSTAFLGRRKKGTSDSGPVV